MFMPHIHTNINTVLHLGSSVLVTIPVTVIIYPDKQCLREHFDSQLRAHSAVVGKSWQQDLELSNHMISAVREQRTIISVQLAVFFYFSPGYKIWNVAVYRLGLLLHLNHYF